jgi:hypothetical protein
MANDFPAFHVTGAVHCWVGTDAPGTTSNVYFLGTCQVQPQFQIQQVSTDVHNDLVGPSLPAQKIDNGEVGSLGLALNRFSKSTLQVLRLLRAGGGVSSNPGRRNRYSRGGLVYGSRTFQLWCVFDNALDGAGALCATNAAPRSLFPGLEAGFWFPQVEILAESDMQLGNGKDEVKLMTFEAQPYFQPISSGYTAVNSGDRQFTLYSNLDAAFPAVVCAPQ